MRHAFQWGRVTANAVAAALFAALFLVFIVQVVARFVFDQPLAWTDELAVVLYIWMVLWCAAFVVRAREHVMFDLVYNIASARVQRWMRLVGSITLAALMGYGLAGNWDYIWFMRREKTPVLGLSFFWVFMPFLFLLVSLIVRNIYLVGRELLGLGQHEAATHEGER